jgi:hypothetical protein
MLSALILHGVAARPTLSDNRSTRGHGSQFLSYYDFLPLRHPTFPVDIKPTVSQRCEPSSRSLLMGEHPHPWWLLHHQDRKSRHRCSKPPRRSIRGILVVFTSHVSLVKLSEKLPPRYLVNSRGRQLCSRDHKDIAYSNLCDNPRSNFSVIPSPHQGGHRGSLGPNFFAEFLQIKNPVRLTFALALHTRFPTVLSQPLGAADIFSAVCHPSQTVHQPVSSFQSE